MPELVEGLRASSAGTRAGVAVDEETLRRFREHAQLGHTYGHMAALSDALKGGLGWDEAVAAATAHAGH
jgi:hypothetical protein